MADSKPHQLSNGGRLQRVQVQNKIKTPTTSSTVLKSFAIKNNGAFNPVTMIGKHATAHKTIKKKIDEKKTVEIIKIKRYPTAVPSLCWSTTVSTKEIPKTRSNTLFTTHNWGNQK